MPAGTIVLIALAIFRICKREFLLLSLNTSFMVPVPVDFSEFDTTYKWEMSLSISMGPPGGMGKSIFRIGATFIFKTKSNKKKRLSSFRRISKYVRHYYVWRN